MTVTPLNSLGLTQQLLSLISGTETAAGGDNIPASEQVVPVTGQNVPNSTGANGADSSGNTTPPLSSEVMATLLQSQETDSMVSSLFDSTDTVSTLSPYSTDPLLAALNNNETGFQLSSPQMLDALMADMQSSANTNTSLQAQNQGLLNYLDGNGEPSSATSPEIQTVQSTLGLNSNGTTPSPNMQDISAILDGEAPAATGETGLDTSALQGLLDMLDPSSTTNDASSPTPNGDQSTQSQPL